MIIPGAIIRRAAEGGASAILKRARLIVVSRSSGAKENALVTALDIHATRKAAKTGIVPTAVMTALDIHTTRKAPREVSLPTAVLTALDIHATRLAIAPAPTTVARRLRLIVISRT